MKKNLQIIRTFQKCYLQRNVRKVSIAINQPHYNNNRNLVDIKGTNMRFYQTTMKPKKEELSKEDKTFFLNEDEPMNEEEIKKEYENCVKTINEAANNENEKEAESIRMKTMRRVVKLANVHKYTPAKTLLGQVLLNQAKQLPEGHEDITVLLGEALRNFEEAAEEEDRDAMFIYAQLVKDMDKKKKLLQKCAEMGEERATMLLQQFENNQVKRFKNLEKEPETPKTLFDEAMLITQTKDMELASTRKELRTILKRVIEMVTMQQDEGIRDYDSLLTHSHFLMYQIEFKEKGYHLDSLKHLRGATKLKEEVPLLEMGLYYEGMNQHDKAFQYYQEAYNHRESLQPSSNLNNFLFKKSKGRLTNLNDNEQAVFLQTITECVHNDDAQSLYNAGIGLMGGYLHYVKTDENQEGIGIIEWDFEKLSEEANNPPCIHQKEASFTIPSKKELQVWMMDDINSLFVKFISRAASKDHCGAIALISNVLFSQNKDGSDPDADRLKLGMKYLNYLFSLEKHATEMRKEDLGMLHFIAAVAYANERGVSKDMEKSYNHLQLAASYGNQDAKAELSKNNHVCSPK